MLARKRLFDLDALHLEMKNIQIKGMKNLLIKGARSIRNFCGGLLLVALASVSAFAQQKVVVITSEQDVFENSILMAAPKGQMVMGPLVPSGTPEKPDIYSMTYYMEGTNRLRNLLFTFDRGDKFVGYDEVALGDGRVLANPAFNRIPAMGRFGETHLLSMSDVTFEKVQKEGMKLEWRTKGAKGKRTSTTFEIPAYFFTGFNKRVEKVLGIGKPVAKAEPASPYIQSGSIGKKTEKAEPKTMPNELSHLKGAELIGQVFIFMPKLPKQQKDGYLFGEVNLSRRLPYENYVGKMVKIVSFNSDLDGNEHYGGQTEETGELIVMMSGKDEVKLPGLALKRDVDQAREKFIGKKVWLKDHRVYTYNEETDEMTPHFKPRFAEFTVQNVVLGTRIAPVRFILEDAGGEVYFYDIYMSRSNTWGAASDLFDYTFYEKNPRQIFSDWSDEAFRLVSLDQVKQGMTKTQVTFALGTPESVTASELGDIKLEMWHYQSKVVTFNKGIVSGIDTLK